MKTRPRVSTHSSPVIPRKSARIMAARYRGSVRRDVRRPPTRHACPGRARRGAGRRRGGGAAGDPRRRRAARGDDAHARRRRGSRARVPLRRGPDRRRARGRAAARPGRQRRRGRRPAAARRRPRRRFYTTSSCGVCGKGALEEVAVHAEPTGPATTCASAARCSRRSPTGSASRSSSAPAGCTRPACSRPAASSSSAARTSAATTRWTRSSAGRCATATCRCAASSCASAAGCRSSSSRRPRSPGAPVLVGVGAPTSLAVRAGDRPQPDAGWFRARRSREHLRGRAPCPRLTPTAPHKPPIQRLRGLPLVGKVMDWGMGPSRRVADDAQGAARASPA